MIAKFKVGDKVRLTRRFPHYIKYGRRNRTRTIIAVHYNQEDQCAYYELGDRGKASLGLFRSYMLRKVSEDQMVTRGRPRFKKGYEGRS